ncbi:MAG: glycosyltransferase family 1 protein, partial [Deltaproteobacteria bacterium]
MLHVLFDSQIFNIQIFGGISRYYYELIRHLSKLEDLRIDIDIWYSNNSYIPENGMFRHRNFFPNRRFPGKHVLMEHLNIWSEIPAIRKQNFSVFHPTYYNPYFLDHIGKKPFVLTVYDMIHERFAEVRKVDRKTSERKKLLVGRASRIIAISGNTRDDLVKYFRIDPGKIDVIHIGTSALPDMTEASKKFFPPEYILFVGARLIYKNFQRFLRAVAPILHEDKHLKIICAGGGKFTADEAHLFEQLSLAGRILQYSAPDTMLWSLYKNARVFVFPSLYEGFGIPVIEAFACGCPIAVSNSSSLPEIARDAACYFDPLDESSIRSAVAQVIHDEDLRARLVQKGLERVRDFSWDKIALETKKTYE